MYLDWKRNEHPTGVAGYRFLEYGASSQPQPGRIFADQGPFRVLLAHRQVIRATMETVAHRMTYAMMP
jgi:hypothetical protein